MLSVILHPDAEAEVDDAATAIAVDRPRSSATFLRALDDAFERLIAFPLSGCRVRGPVRRLVLPGWRYSVIYSVEAWGIYVLAVAHHSRKPGYWRYRLR